MGGPRVRKDHRRIEAIGGVDELNAALGIAVTFLHEGEMRGLLIGVQNDLFTVGAELSLPEGGRPRKALTPLNEDRIAALEEAIDTMGAELGDQHAFVLPGGSKEAALLHYTRAVARRAERRIVALASQEPVNPTILGYLNRLSSLLYAMALKANKDAGVEERNPTYP